MPLVYLLLTRIVHNRCPSVSVRILAVVALLALTALLSSVATDANPSQDGERHSPAENADRATLRTALFYRATADGSTDDVSSVPTAVEHTDTASVPAVTSEPSLAMPTPSAAHAQEFASALATAKPNKEHGLASLPTHPAGENTNAPRVDKHRDASLAVRQQVLESESQKQAKQHDEYDTGKMGEEEPEVAAAADLDTDAFLNTSLDDDDGERQAEADETNKINFVSATRRYDTVVGNANMRIETEVHGPHELTAAPSAPPSSSTAELPLLLRAAKLGPTKSAAKQNSSSIKFPVLLEMRTKPILTSRHDGRSNSSQDVAALAAAAPVVRATVPDHFQPDRETSANSSKVDSTVKSLLELPILPTEGPKGVCLSHFCCAMRYLDLVFSCLKFAFIILFASKFFQIQHMRCQHCRWP